MAAGTFLRPSHDPLDRDSSTKTAYVGDKFQDPAEGIAFHSGAKDLLCLDAGQKERHGQAAKRIQQV